MPSRRKPGSAPISDWSRPQMARLSLISGISALSRPCWRHQPQLRLDCSPAMLAFSIRGPELPRRGGNKRQERTPEGPQVSAADGAPVNGARFRLQAAGLVIGERLIELGLGVHDEGAVFCDRLVERTTRDQQNMRGM